MNECTNFAYGGMAVLQLPEQTAFAVWSQDYAYTEEEWERIVLFADLHLVIGAQTAEHA